MNRKILFSPIGGTDPISLNNYHDGSMLHICRVYRPTEIVLYLSKEMIAFQEEDDRFRYSLNKLFELQGRKDVQVKEILRPELSRVQEYDYFYQEFKEILTGIASGMESTDELLINVSSGTPAMKSSLLVLQTLGEIPSKTIQVITPAGKLNEHSHIGYDIETLWELNPDNEPGFKNRCYEIHCPSLTELKKEEIVKQHLAVYDYEAALSVANTMSSGGSYKSMIELGKERLLLDSSAADVIAKREGIDCFPVKNSAERPYFEYALALSIKLKRQEYADFIRGITPLLVDLFKMALKRQCNVDIEQYTRIDSTGGERWNDMALAGTDVLNELNRQFKSFNGGFVYSVHLVKLIEAFSDKPAFVQCVLDLRTVEEKIRHIAAHQIVSISAEKIKRNTGFNPEEIMKLIKHLFSYAGINIKAEHWNSYDTLNEMIIREMYNF